MSLDLSGLKRLPGSAQGGAVWEGKRPKKCVWGGVLGYHGHLFQVGLVGGSCRVFLFFFGQERFTHFFWPYQNEMAEPEVYRSWVT